MATYGKRKKGLLSSFSVFQDDKPEQSLHQVHSTYTRLGKAKTMMQRSRSRGRPEESSGDELADSAVLYNIPHGPARLPSLRSPGAIAAEDIIRPISSKLTKTVGEDLDKPLPPIPPKDPFTEQRQHWQSRTALSKKTTNMKASTSDAKRAAKPVISSPVLQGTSNTTIPVPASSRPTTAHTTQSAFGVQTSTSGAAELSRKISNLMAQAAAQEEQTKLRAEIYAAESAKLSPLEKGKKVFAKATRAIKDRLSSNSNEKPLNPRRPVTNRHSSFQELGPPPQYESMEELSRGRLDRRIAEGENLSNPKIKSLTGDGNVPRKPLPVYETMRSRSQRSEPAGNPFTDGKELEHHLPREDFSGFDFDFSKHKHKRKLGPASPASENSPDQIDGASGTPDQYLAVPQSNSKFSNLVSGLAQHSDTMYFSSSPVAYSTPRIRLEPQLSADVDMQSTRLLSRSPSIMDFSSEDQNDDVSSEDLSFKHHKARASDGSSLSIKRKSATEDLRSQLPPATKKARTDSTISKDDLGLEDGIDQLDPGDERAPLSPKSGNTGDCKPNVITRKGVSIFDVGKGKAPECKEEDTATKTRPRPNAIKRSSITRPSSVLFSRGRESRIGMRRHTQSDDDEMDIDELQLDDAAFQTGGKKM